MIFESAGEIHSEIVGETEGEMSTEPSDLASVGHNSPYAIRIRHLWHRFGAINVLRDVTFDVEHGQIFGFIGPNGAGKTTTIRVIATLIEPMAGRVEVDGYDVAIDPEKVRTIVGYMPDHAGVYERVTTREYLEFFADAYRISNIGVVDTVMELTDINQVQHKLVMDMSKGMKQRLQLARVLLHDPKILVLDEPASDLDPRARIEMRDLLLELRALGKTVFLSSHILTELADVCTSVAILERGALVVAGPIATIADQLEQRRYAAGNSLRPPTRASGRHAQLPATPSQTLQPSAAAVSTEAGNQPPQEGALSPQIPLPFTPAGVPVPGSARRRLKLRLLGNPAQAVQLLQGPQSILGTEVLPGGVLIVDYQGSDILVAQMVRHLVTHGVAIVGVEPERNELERIFLEVTQGNLQ